MHSDFWRAALLCGAATLACAANAQPASEMSIMHVQGNVYMLHAGDDGNIAVQIGSDGIMLVNALREGLTDDILTTLATVSPKLVRYIIDTSVDARNAGGNAELAARGMFGATNSAGQGATLVAHENVLLRWGLAPRRGEAARPEAGRPGDNYYLPQKDIYFNGEPVFVMHAPNAHSDGDSIVLFRKSDTIAVGDIFTPDAYPVIDVEYGGSVQGIIDALNRILDLAVPARLQDGGTRIVPGRGRLCNEADVVEYRDMVVIVRDRIRYMLDQDMSLREIIRARPTLDYDTQYGSGDAFVESIVASLTASR